MVSLLSSEDNKRTISALEHAIAQTNSGVHPNEALKSAALKFDLTAELVKRAAEAYNVSKTLSHFKKSASPAEKKADFPLADGAKIVDDLFFAERESGNVKSASEHVQKINTSTESYNFNRPQIAGVPPEWKNEKKAEAYPEETSGRERRAFAKLAALTRAESEAKGRLNNFTFELFKKAEDAAMQFRQNPRVSFEKVEEQIVGQYGALGKTALDMVYHLGNLEKVGAKRATKSAERPWYSQFAEPYLGVEDLIKAGETYHELVDAVFVAEKDTANHRKTTQIKEAKSIKIVNCMLDTVLGDYPGFDKRAAPEGGGGAIGTGALNHLSGILEQGGRGLLAATGNPVGSAEGAKTKARMEVTNPAHEATLNSIKSQAMLNDFMTNDPVLSTHEPEKVLNAYNELTQLSPHVATQPAVARGLLRRMLQQENVIEPFEAAQTANVEKALSGRATDVAPSPGGK